MDKLLEEVRRCELCRAHLPQAPKPVLAASATSRIVIVGQAPGSRVQATGIPWNDPSGELLRQWMGVDRDSFYNAARIALVPMGFCYPGKGRSGDLPPRPECAPQWHPRLFAQMPQRRLTLLIGQYAQRHYLGARAGKTLTETVRRHADYLPEFFPLPHPSPRNRLWLRRNPWFDAEVVPRFRALLQELLDD